LGIARHGRLFRNDDPREDRRARWRRYRLHLHGARVSTTIVSIFAIAVVAWRGELKALIFDLETEPLLWAIAGGIALTIAVSSLFHALSLGPTNVVVPIYGMFIVGGSLLGVLFVGEPFTWNKIVGLAAPVIGVVLISL
jgi:transporter family protein